MVTSVGGVSGVAGSPVSFLVANLGQDELDKYVSDVIDDYYDELYDNDPNHHDPHEPDTWELSCHLNDAGITTIEELLDATPQDIIDYGPGLSKHEFFGILRALESKGGLQVKPEYYDGKSKEDIFREMSTCTQKFREIFE